jgi:hypothetical protein
MVYNELKSKIEHLPQYNTKIAKSVFDKLDCEDVADIILDGNVFWFEHHLISGHLTNRQHDWLVKYLTKKGYTYLYNL